MKTLITILFLFSVSGNPSLSEVRKSFTQAAGSKAVAIELSAQLSAVGKSSSKVLLAYKGAVLTLLAKFEKDKQAKKQYFKEGVGLIEYAAEQSPDDIEIRFVRMTVQENTPRFLNYKKDIEEDKAYLLSHFQQIKSADLKKYILNYVTQSDAFSETEKNSLK